MVEASETSPSLTSHPHLSSIEAGLPSYRSGIRLDHVFGMASHTAVVRLSSAGRHQLSVSGAASDANPFGGGGRIAHLLCRSSSGCQLLQGAANELRRLRRSPRRERGTNGIIRGRNPVAQPHQRLNRIL